MDFLHTPALLFLPYPRGLSPGRQENRGKHYPRGREHQRDRRGSASVDDAETPPAVGEAESGAGRADAVFVPAESEEQKSP